MNFTINETMIIAGVTAIASYFIKHLIDRNKELKDKAEQTLMDEIRAATKAVTDCREQLVKHAHVLEGFSAQLAMMPKFQNDVNAAHEKIRTMEIRLHTALSAKEGNGA